MTKYNNCVSHFLPQSSPMILSVILVWIEVISWLCRPLALSVRLMANITASHLLMFLCGSSVFLSSTYFIFPLLFLIVLAVLEVSSYILSSYSWKFIILLEDLGSTFIKFFFLLTWLVLSLSELNRTPFDLVEGESELVSGLNVEYSSFGFTLLFLSEYMNIWFMSNLFMLLYNSSLTFMCFSVIFYVLLNLFIRGLLPRYKFIQLINLMWKGFLPFVFIILLFFMVNIFL